MSYRDDVEALRHRCEILEREVTTSARDLDEARRLLAEAKERRRLPVLENLHVAAPCSADWSKMVGDDRSRHCSECDKNVYNLSSMTRVEAEALLIEREGQLCVRYYQRTDGTVLTADCPVGQTRRRRRRRVVAAAFGAMSALTAAAATLHRGGPPVRVMMGAPPPAPQVISKTDPRETEPLLMMMGDVAASLPPARMGGIGLPPQPKMGKPKMGKRVTGEVAIGHLRTNR